MAVNDETKSKLFDDEVRKFIAQSIETIKTRYGAVMEFGEVRTELVCINKYLSIYNSMKPEEHYQYFENLYNRNRQAVLNCRKDNLWIIKNKLTIQFGEGTKLAEKCKQIRIPITDIFTIAFDLQDKAEAMLDGFEDRTLGGKDLIRPNILLLHLIRIFYYLTDGSDREQLSKIISELEDELGVPNDKRVAPSLNTVTAPSSDVNPGSAVTGGLSGLFTMATSMMQKMGINPPEGLKTPSEDEITNVISSVFNSEVTQNAIQGVFSSLNGQQDLGSAIGQMMKGLADPNAMAAIQETVNNTAQAVVTTPQLSAPSTTPDEIQV